MYKRPFEYTEQTIEKVMNKRIRLAIGNIITSEVEEYLTGIITHCGLAANPPYLPSTLTIVLDNGTQREISIGEIIQFSDLN